MIGKLKRLWQRLPEARRIARLKKRQAADYQRWQDMEALSSKWDERTIKMAALIPENSSVLEFGAGRMILKQHLPPGCRYTPSDLVDRGENTLVIDLNGKQLGDIPATDVAVFSGVLEYINDVPRLIRKLSQNTGLVIASYATTEKESSRVKRRAQGWVNDYSHAQLLALFDEQGYQGRDKGHWKAQQIYQFGRKNT